MKYGYLLILVWGTWLITTGACKSGNDTDQNRDHTESVSFPVLPEETKQLMRDSCDYIDYIFYELPFSMSQDARSAIVANIGFITSAAIEKPLEECTKPIARVIYQIRGDIVTEADLYLSDNCNYFVFMENNQPKYATRISTQGVAFYKQIIQQVTSPAPQ